MSHQKKSNMKNLLVIITTSFMAILPAKALDYEEARQRAWFLTDKMAYELNLTPEQYDRAYQINLDYFASIRSAADCYGNYWAFRNADLHCVLFDWQYTLYTTLDYFFRPIRMIGASWYYPILSHYRRGYYYFARPTVYVSYHSPGWHRRGRNDASPYRGMTFRPGNGMRDRYHGHTGSRPSSNSGFGRPGNDRPGGKPGANRPGNDRPNRPGTPGNTGSNRPGGNNSSSRPSTEKSGTSTRSNRNYQSSGSSNRSTTNVRPSQNRNTRSSKSSSSSSSKTSRTSRTFGR